MSDTGSSLPAIYIIAATRSSAEDFFTHTLLGQSLSLTTYAKFNLVLTPNNSEGLPVVYNRAIERHAKDDAVLVFAHDDVYLPDFLWPWRVTEAARVYDLSGAVGNKRRLPRQPSWVHVDTDFTWDEPEYLTGVAAKGWPPIGVGMLTEPGVPVKLLDGMLLIARSAIFTQYAIRFDTRFQFHFYDVDLCRQCEVAGASMGSWPIAVAHQSTGAFDENWHNEYQTYLDKWGE